MKTLKQHCQECPTFAEKLKEVVLSADFQSHMFPSGVDQSEINDKGTWLHKARNAFIQGKQQ